MSPTLVLGLLLAAPLGPELEARYVGTHAFGVNRVNEGRRVGTLVIEKKDGKLRLKGRLERGPNWLELEGEVHPIDGRSFELVGTLRGAPDLTYRGTASEERTTHGKFYFRAKGARKFWRLYEVEPGSGPAADAAAGGARPLAGLVLQTSQRRE